MYSKQELIYNAQARRSQSSIALSATIYAYRISTESAKIAGQKPILKKNSNYHLLNMMEPNIIIFLPNSERTDCTFTPPNGVLGGCPRM